MAQQQQQHEGGGVNECPNPLPPTMAMAWGPLWFPHHPKKNVICGDDADEDGGRFLMKAKNIFRRSLVDVGSTKLELSGRVLDSETCEPIPNAVIDFWQPDSKGRYSLAADGDCRGAVLTDESGRYSVTTTLTGNYGITAGTGYKTFGFELPPFSLAHIHVALFPPGRVPFATQLTFPDDKTRGLDFREFLSSPRIHLSDESLVLNLRKSNDGSHSAVFDFVVGTNKTNGVSGIDLFDDPFNSALRDVVCVSDGFDPAEPLPLCHADGFFFKHVSPPVLFSTAIPFLLYGIPTMVAVVFYLIVTSLLKMKKPKETASKKKKTN